MLHGDNFPYSQVQQSLEKIAKLEQEKEHWMLEAQLAKIKLEKENKKVSEKARTSVGNQLIEATTENSFVLNAMEQEKDDGAEKTLTEPVQSTSLVSVLHATEVVKYCIFFMDVYHETMDLLISTLGELAQ